jgi:hypothetical protein
LETIFIVYKDFIINGNIISILNCKERTIILHPIIKGFEKECFSYFKMKSIELPFSLESLGEECFKECSSLSSINLPTSFQSLGYRCFYKCSALPSLIENQFLIEVSKITNYVNSITGSLSNKIESLQKSNLRISFKFPNEQFNVIRKWKTILIVYEDFIINDNIISMLNCKEQTIILHPIIKGFEKECFSYFKMRSVELPFSLESLGEECFKECSSLVSINFPASLHVMGENCFSGCSELPLKIQKQFQLFNL